MYLGFLDDSGSTGDNLDDSQTPFQVIGGPIIGGEDYRLLEFGLSIEISNSIPEDEWEKFEFKTSQLFWAKPPFEKLGLDKCRKLIERVLLNLTNNLHAPIVYGHVNKKNLQQGRYHTANPISIAFQEYLETLDAWFFDKFTKQSNSEMPPNGLLICDDSGTKKEKEESGRRDARTIITNEYRRRRKKPRGGVGLGPTNWLLDDIYFGDSKNSRGIQAADVCVFLIAKHLEGNPEVKPYYDIIRDLVVAPSLPTDPNDLEQMFLAERQDPSPSSERR